MDAAHRALLGRWQEWALRTQAERYAKRRSSTVGELRRFYDDLLPTMNDILGALGSKPLAELDEQERQMLCVCLSWVEVASAVELFDDADARHSMSGDRFSISVPGGRPVDPPTRSTKGYTP